MQIPEANMFCDWQGVPGEKGDDGWIGDMGDAGPDGENVRACLYVASLITIV